MNKNFGFQLGHPEIHLSGYHQESSAFFHMCWEYLGRALAAICLACFLPIFGMIWLWMKLFDPGPMFFKQQRPGYQGQQFTIYKIRTMQIGAEKKTALGTQNDAPEVTRLGMILRKLKIDEAPQLLNIVKGDMVIVGPRPIPIPLDAELRKGIPGFSMRYNVKPGLTSVGQICVNDNALGDALIKDWKLRFEGELHYIRNRSVHYDCIMVLMTTAYVIRKTFAR